jgi:acyl-CoA synthetase (AMP-forming)/AMP-acid ligase II
MPNTPSEKISRSYETGTKSLKPTPMLVLTLLYLPMPNSLNFRTVRTKRQCLYYLFEDSAHTRLNDDCIWSREGCYTWAQTYNRVNQYAQWYLEQGVKPHDLVSFYMTNSPDFIFAWLGLWAIGAAPAMINYNLSGKALMHCLRVAGSKLILVDEDPELRKRIEDARDEIEGLGNRIVVLDNEFRRQIDGKSEERPGDELREGVQGNWPMSIFYTRFVDSLP